MESIDRNEITREVIAFHEMEAGPEKEKEEKRLLRITEELIYIAPVENGYISETDACGFYLEERRNSGKILDAYRISKLSYPDYISQIMRVRVRNYLIHKREEESDIKRLHYAERVHNDPTYVMDLDEIYSTEGSTARRNPKLEGKSPKTVKEAFDRILKETSEMEYEDRNLKPKAIRHGLLCMLLSLPKGGGYEYIDHIAKLLKIDEYQLLDILRLRDELDSTREKRIEKHREVIGKHFKILLRLNTAYKLTDDEEEKEKINEVSMRLEELIDRRCERMRHESIGLTQREMANILGISRSTISADMKKTRIYLTSLL